MCAHRKCICVYTSSFGLWYLCVFVFKKRVSFEPQEGNKTPVCSCIPPHHQHVPENATLPYFFFCTSSESNRCYDVGKLKKHYEERGTDSTHIKRVSVFETFALDSVLSGFVSMKEAELTFSNPFLPLNNE